MSTVLLNTCVIIRTFVVTTPSETQAASSKHRFLDYMSLLNMLIDDLVAPLLSTSRLSCVMGESSAGSTKGHIPRIQSQGWRYQSKQVPSIQFC
jgi:hypothetical protein